MGEALVEELKINPDILNSNATKDYSVTTSKPIVENTSSTFQDNLSTTLPTTTEIIQSGNVYLWIYTYWFKTPILSQFTECCDTLELSSTGLANSTQPFSFGTYQVQNDSNGTSRTYVKLNDRFEHYLFKYVF